jgi:hypothetical protein
MWLPKDERRLLAGYYRLIKEAGTWKEFSPTSLTELLKLWPDIRVPAYNHRFGDVKTTFAERPHAEQVECFRGIAAEV